MKILFVIPEQHNVYGGKTTKPRLPHAGIAYLSAYLKKHGHQVDVFDCTVENNHDLLFSLSLRTCDIVGISLYSLNIGSSYLFVNEIVTSLKKYSGKKIPVVLGGPHVTVAGKEVLMKTEADFAIRGEGELTLSELVTDLQNVNSFNQINGLLWRDKRGAIVENQAREFIEDVNSLPFPDYSVFKLERYKSYELNEIPITTSRGCPFDCLFCAVNLITGKRFRARSPVNIIQEIIANYNKGIRNFYVNDDMFNLDMKRAEEICDLIIKNDLKINFVFQNGLRVDCLTPKLVEKLSKAGCVTIVLSAESGNNDVLQAIRKRISVEDIRKAVDIVDRANITFIVNFIIGHPTETYAKAMDSIRLAKEVAKKKNCATVMFFNLIPYPQTAVFEWIEKNGKWIIPKEKYLDSSMLALSPIFESSDFTRKERLALLKKGNKIHRGTLLKFIFGKYIGILAYFATNLAIVQHLLQRFSFSSKAGQEVAYNRFLRKLYHLFFKYTPLIYLQNTVFFAPKYRVYLIYSHNGMKYAEWEEAAEVLVGRSTKDQRKGEKR